MKWMAYNMLRKSVFRLQRHAEGPHWASGAGPRRVRGACRPLRTKKMGFLFRLARPLARFGQGGLLPISLRANRTPLYLECKPRWCPTFSSFRILDKLPHRLVDTPTCPALQISCPRGMLHV